MQAHIGRVKAEYQHYLGSFLLQASMMAGMTLIPFFTFEHLGGRERAAALAYGVQMLALGGTCIVSAPFLSVVSNGLIYCLIGAIGFGVFYGAAVFAHNVTVFCILTGSSMAFFALAWPAVQSWLGAQPDETLRTKSFSYFNIAIGLGLTVAPFIAGILDEIDYRLAFLAVLVSSALAAVLFFTLPSERRYFGDLSGARTHSEPEVAGEPRVDHASERYLYCGWLTNMLGWGLTAAVRTVYAGQLDQLVRKGQLVLFTHSSALHVFTYQHSPTAATLYSWLQTILSLGYFAAILLMSRMTTWQHQFWLVVACHGVLGAAIWLLVRSDSFLVIGLCHVLMGAFTAFGYLSSQCYSSADPRRKHRRIALNEGLSNMNSFVFPLAFAQLGVWYGMTWAFKYTPALLMVYVGAEFLSLKYAQRRFPGRVLSAQHA